MNIKNINKPNLLICVFYLIKEIFKYIINFFHYTFIAILILYIFQIIILILFITKYNVDYLLYKYRPRKTKSIITNVTQKKNENFHSFDCPKNSKDINLNPPKKNNKPPREMYKKKEDMLLENVEESKNTKEKNNKLDNITEKINETYKKNKNESNISSNIEKEKSNNLIHKTFTINYLDSSINLTNNLNSENSNLLNYKYKYNRHFINFKNNEKILTIKYYYIRYVPFISIFYYNDLNIYIIKLSLFIFWLNLHFFLNICFHKFLLLFSYLLPIILIFILQLITLTDYNLYNLLNHGRSKEAINNFKKKYKLFFMIYFIFIFISFLIEMLTIYYIEEKKKDFINLCIYFVISIAIYIIIIPVFLIIFIKLDICSKKN